MSPLRFVPGVGQWRAGERGKALLCGTLTAFLAGVLVWRRELVTRALGGSGDGSAARGSLRPDRMEVLASAAIIVLFIGLLSLTSWRRSRHAGKSREESLRRSAPRSIAWRRLRRSRLALGGAAIVASLALVALICPLLAPYDPAAQGDLATGRLLVPSLEHPLGTDEVARDVLSRLLYGSRASLLVGFLSMAIAVVLGTLYGAAAGHFGGWVDGVLMRMIDVLLAFPALVFLITVVGVWDAHSIWVIASVIGLMSWMRVARIVRGQVLALREREFVLAARALGAGAGRLIFRHLLPNSLTPIIVFATLGVGNAILLEAGLSYLGIGVQPPTPSWGNIVSESRGEIFSHWWIPFSAGLAIVVTVVGYNLLGDGLRDALDPRSRKGAS